MGQPLKVFSKVGPGGASPGDDGANADQSQQNHAYRDIDLIVKRRSHGDFYPADGFGYDRKNRSPEGGEANAQKHQIVYQETGLTGQKRIQFVFTF